VNLVVPSNEVLPAAIKMAQQIIENSPDSVQSTKRGLLLSNELASVEQIVQTHMWTEETNRVYKGQNIKVRIRSLPLVIVPDGPSAPTLLTGGTQGVYRGKYRRIIAIN
jgi:hypothetical protein